MSKSVILSHLKGKHILILGFGREGKSTYRFIHETMPDATVTIADINSTIDTTEIIANNHSFILGENYLQNISSFDIIIKSPGISLRNHPSLVATQNISSQTDLFLQAYAPQCIGITGTKGKSTTASLIYHILQTMNMPSLLAGNIGIPLFDVISQITEKEKIVMELSSHQLEFIQQGPAIAVLLNLFEEHLDHYKSFYDYQVAKFNIATTQQETDFFIHNTTDNLINQLLKDTNPRSQRMGFSYAPDNQSSCYVKDNCFIFKSNNKEIKLFAIEEHFPLKGTHNLVNTCAALLTVMLSQPISDYSALKKAVYSFHSLAHRLEYVATINDVTYYNDSISTIPQATQAALEAIKNVNTLILGGMDRGIDYSPLINIFIHSDVENFIFTGKAGERMMQLCKQPENKKYYFSNDYKEIIKIAKKVTRKNHVCLLSPAASSYDMFKNFEERGDVFKKCVIRLSSDLK